MKEYIKYLNNNPKGYWFKRKIYGWGWTPAKWQGWLVTFIYIGIILFFALTIDEYSPRNEIIYTFILPFVLLTIIFIKIISLKGEKPKWMWGIPKEEL
ncbi:MAG: hypothetical protein ACI83D_000688 [Planctomycetota bacterium]|jgi:hypothetical protein